MMQLFALAVVLLLALCSNSHAFRLLASRAGLRSSLSMAGDVVVVGLAGGVAETLVCKLIASGTPASAFLDRRPYSPSLLEAVASTPGMVYCGSPGEEIIDLGTNRAPRQSVEELLANKLVVVVEDEGDLNLRTLFSLGGQSTPSQEYVSKFANSVPTLRGAVCTASVASVAASGKGFGSLFGGKGAAAFRSVCENAGKPFSLVQYGKLIGGIPGAEPLAFVGLPLLEPELDQSYILKSVLASRPGENKYAASETLTRDSLAEMLAQLVARSDKKGVSERALDALVVSIAGPEPQQVDWDKIFNRLLTVGDVELLRIDFQSVPKQLQFVNWLADTWFPQALIDADAATVLSGSRPVRAVKTSPATVRIFWEDLQSDLTVRAVGSLEITVNSAPDSLEDASFVPSIRAVRVAAEPLPGESLLMDKLLEAINKSAYKKKFVVAL
ncbi:hypothetical protein B484DRAFT_445329 [Ochromonadaceae sp. CCMP2298]|nr:hypothetical protein B484DRAFT_445329 [Ochromonadaceae sp. CCMP2298]